LMQHSPVIESVNSKISKLLTYLLTVLILHPCWIMLHVEVLSEDNAHGPCLRHTQTYDIFKTFYAETRAFILSIIQ